MYVSEMLIGSFLIQCRYYIDWPITTKFETYETMRTSQEGEHSGCNFLFTFGFGYFETSTNIFIKFET